MFHKWSPIGSGYFPRNFSGYPENDKRLVNSMKCPFHSVSSPLPPLRWVNWKRPVFSWKHTLHFLIIIFSNYVIRHITLGAILIYLNTQKSWYILVKSNWKQQINKQLTDYDKPSYAPNNIMPAYLFVFKQWTAYTQTYVWLK